MKRMVLVPIEAVEDLDAAIDVVDTAVETASLMLMDQDADFCIAPNNRENDSTIEVDEKFRKIEEGRERVRMDWGMDFYA